MHGLLFKTQQLAFLDYKLFEDLPLSNFEEIGESFDIAAGLVAVAPVLAAHLNGADGPLFHWMLRRINHLSDGRLTLDSEHGDEGYYPLSILVTRGAKPVAVLEFDGNNYGICCFTRGEDADERNSAIGAFLEACAANPKLTRAIPILDDD
jgi:hypothetical protein